MIKLLGKLLPWIAIGLIAWRQEQLEEATTQFVVAANKTIQVATDGFEQRLKDAVEAIIAQAGSAN